MKYCGNCGTKAEDGVKFCPGCGAALQAQTVPREASSQQPRPQNGQPPKQKGSAKGKLSDLNNTADTTASFRPDDIEKNKMMGVLAYILFLIPLLAAKESPFARFHANQGLLVFIGGVVAGIASSILAFIPVLGWILGVVLCCGVSVLGILGIINAVNGQAKELPLIGKFKILK